MQNVLNLKDALPEARKLPGLHLIGDLFDCGCTRSRMTDPQWLEAHCLELVRNAGLTAIAPLFYSFGDNAGVTGLVVLAESHLSVHTWPDEGYVTIDVYVCNYSSDNRGKARELFDELVQTFSPRDPRIVSLNRA